MATPEQFGIVGAVLAGGRSTRMGGGDKGLLPLAGTPMLGRVIERFRPQVTRLVINANGDPARFDLFGVTVVPDGNTDFLGPLAGLLAAMRWAARHVPDAPRIATVSSDVPFLPVDLVMRLAASVAGQPRTIALAASNGQVHPIIGLWPVELADELARALAEGTRKVSDWTSKTGTETVEFSHVTVSGHSIDPFFNANTPAELSAASVLLEASASDQLEQR